MGPITTIKNKDNFPGPGSYKVYSEFGDLPKLKKRKYKKKKKKSKKNELSLSTNSPSSFIFKYFQKWN